MAVITRTTLKYMGVKESISLDKPKLLAIAQKLTEIAKKYDPSMGFSEELFRDAGFSDDIGDVFVNDPQLSGGQETAFGKVDKACGALSEALDAAADWMKQAADKIG